MNTNNYRLGFTLIELLVVITIIGLLASTVLASLNQARVRAQYSVAQQDLRLIQNAILMAEPYNAPLLSITGSGCSQCSCTLAVDLRNIVSTSPCMIRWTQTIQNISNASVVLDTGTRLLRDPWGSPYLLDENEGEFPANPCARDYLRSAGPDGVRQTSDDIIITLPNRTLGC